MFYEGSQSQPYDFLNGNNGGLKVFHFKLSLSKVITLKCGPWYYWKTFSIRDSIKSFPPAGEKVLQEISI